MKKLHKPIAVLDGRYGKTLSSWLKDDKHIKVFTRDRASAYAKIIEQELPYSMQIADRFHIHQNLLKAIKKVLYKEISSTIKIENDIKIKCKSEQNDNGNKNPKNCG